MFREMRRKAQQIEYAGCEEILRSARRGVLAVQGDDGYPYAMPMDFVYEDGRIWFHGAKAGHRIDAVRRCGKVSFCVLDEGVQEENDWWYHFTSVIAFGMIREVENPGEAEVCLRKLGRKYFPTEEMVEDDIRRNAARASVLELRIEHMTGKRVKER